MVEGSKKRVEHRRKTVKIGEPVLSRGPKGTK